MFFNALLLSLLLSKTVSLPPYNSSCWIARKNSSGRALNQYYSSSAPFLQVNCKAPDFHKLFILFSLATQHPSFDNKAPVLYSKQTNHISFTWTGDDSELRWPLRKGGQTEGKMTKSYPMSCFPSWQLELQLNWKFSLPICVLWHTLKHTEAHTLHSLLPAETEKKQQQLRCGKM